ncbi:MAG: N-acetyltransferase NAT13 [Amphiamblys sp. WSBS2006]|nr:MAG: N-acetyltransferase NAT13 [Amphiamblys sp. WSBS2006]
MVGLNEEKIEFREIDTGDSLLVKELHAILFPATYGFMYCRKILRRETGCVCVLVYAGAQCVGIMTTRRDGDSVYITGLGIVRSYRRRGVGRECLGFLLEKTEWAVGYALHTEKENTAAVLFYKKFGASVEGTVCGYYGPGRDAVLLTVSREVLLSSF